MAVTGWKTATLASAAAVAGDAGTVAWSGAGLERTDDGNPATATLTNSDVRSRTIRNYGFGFAADIPAGSAILGIEVNIKRLGTTTNRISDDILYLTDDGTVANVTQRIGGNRATAAAWPTAYAYESHGGAADLWGATITAAMVRSTGFGLHYAAKYYSGTAGGAQAWVDAISMRITFEPPPVTGNANITEGGDTAISTSGYVPALDLDFVSSETPDARITISGGANGTRVNSSGLIVAASAPRYDYDPVTLALRGLKIEGARTNIIAQSASLSGFNFPNRTNNAAVAPDGATVATLVKSSVGNTGSGASGFTFAAGGQTFSVFMKWSDASISSIGAYDTTIGGFAALARITWSVAGVPTAAVLIGTATASIKEFPGGWYRIDLAFSSPAGNGGLFFVYPESTSDPANTGKGIYIWGAQLEAGAYSSSYIPTGAGSVTRSADNHSMTGTNFSSWYNPEKGTFFVEFIPETAVGARYIFAANDAASSWVAAYHTTIGFFTVRVAGIDQAGLNMGAAAAGSAQKIAVAYAANDFAGSTNGGATATDTSGTVPTVNRLTIGSNEAQPIPWFGHIRRLKYYNERLPNAVVQNLTKTFTGSAAITEANDSAVGTGQVKVHGQASITEGGDTVVSAGETGVTLRTPDGRTGRAGTSRLANRTAADAPSLLANRTAR